jgi:hypothetical protein
MNFPGIPYVYRLLFFLNLGHYLKFKKTPRIGVSDLDSSLNIFQFWVTMCSQYSLSSRMLW